MLPPLFIFIIAIALLVLSTFLSATLAQTTTTTATATATATTTTTSESSSSDNNNTVIALSVSLGSAALLSVVSGTVVFLIIKRRASRKAASSGKDLDFKGNFNPALTKSDPVDLEANYEQVTAPVLSNSLPAEHLNNQNMSRKPSFLRSTPVGSVAQMNTVTLLGLLKDAPATTVSAQQHSFMRRASHSATSLASITLHNQEPHNNITVAGLPSASPQSHLATGYHSRTQSSCSVNKPSSRMIIPTIEKDMNKLIHRQNTTEGISGIVNTGSMGSMVIIPANVPNKAIANGKKSSFAINSSDAKSKPLLQSFVNPQVKSLKPSIGLASNSLPALLSHTSGSLVLGKPQSSEKPVESKKSEESQPEHASEPAVCEVKNDANSSGKTSTKVTLSQKSSLSDDRDTSDTFIMKEGKADECLVTQIVGISQPAEVAAQVQELPVEPMKTQEQQQESPPLIAADKKVARASKLMFKENVEKTTTAESSGAPPPSKNLLRYSALKATWRGTGTILPTMERLFNNLQKLIGTSDLTPNSTLANRTISVDEHGQVRVGNFQRVLSYPAFQELNVETDLQTSDKIGEGGFGEVFKGRIINANLAKKLKISIDQDVAVKRVKIADIAEKAGTLSQKRRRALEERALTDFMQEVSICYLLQKYPNIVKLYGCARQPYLITVTKIYCGSLMQYIHRQINFSPFPWRNDVENGQLWPTITAGLMYDLALATQAMHKNGLAHVDIKPGNMLLERIGPTAENESERDVSNVVAKNSPWRLILTDFGLTRVLDAKVEQVKGRKNANANGLSFRYAAPEAFTILHSPNSSKTNPSPATFLAIDIYAVAVTMFHCLTREQPWGPGVNMQIVQRFVKDGKRPELLFTTKPTDAVSLKIDSFIEKCWAQQPQDRWTIDKLVSHLGDLEVLVAQEELKHKAQIQATQRVESTEEVESHKTDVSANSVVEKTETVHASEIPNSEVGFKSTNPKKSNLLLPSKLSNCVNAEDISSPHSNSKTSQTLSHSSMELEQASVQRSNTQISPLRAKSHSNTFKAKGASSDQILLSSQAEATSSVLSRDENVPTTSEQAKTIDFNDKTALLATEYVGTLPLRVLETKPQNPENLVYGRHNIPALRTQSVLDAVFTPPTVIRERYVKDQDNEEQCSIGDQSTRPIDQNAVEMDNSQEIARDAPNHLSEPESVMLSTNQEQENPAMDVTLAPVFDFVAQNLNESASNETVGNYDTQPENIFASVPTSLPACDYGLAISPPQLYRQETSMTVVPPLNHTDSNVSFATIAPKSNFGNMTSAKATTNDNSVEKSRVQQLNETCIIEEIEK